MARRPTDSPAGFSRRVLLRRGGAVAVVGAAGVISTTTLLGQARRYPEARPACELLYLSKREFAILAALADTVFPPGNPLGHTGTEARVPEYIDRMLAALEPEKAADLKKMLLLFEHGTLAFGLRFRRFSSLPAKARARYLHHWESSAIYTRRAAVTAIKTLLGMAYFAHPEVRASLGIHPLCATPADAEPREEWS